MHYGSKNSTVSVAAVIEPVSLGHWSVAVSVQVPFAEAAGSVANVAASEVGVPPPGRP